MLLLYYYMCIEIYWIRLNREKNNKNLNEQRKGGHERNGKNQQFSMNICVCIMNITYAIITDCIFHVCVCVKCHWSGLIYSDTLRCVKKSDFFYSNCVCLSKKSMHKFLINWMKTQKTSKHIDILMDPTNEYNIIGIQFEWRLYNMQIFTDFMNPFRKNAADVEKKRSRINSIQQFVPSCL